MAKTTAGSWIIAVTIPLLAAVAGVAGLLWLWPMATPQEALPPRLPGGDGRPAPTPASQNVAPLKGTLESFNTQPSDIPGQWPRFRGSQLDNISTDETPLNRNWSESGLPELWSIEVGEGFAGASIWQGRVYLIDYDRDAQTDVVRCLSLDTGQDLWRYRYPVQVKRWHGMSRTVPTVAEPYVVSMGPKCHVSCLNALTGEAYWLMDLVRDYQTTVPQWYTAQCPLVEDGKAILAPGNKALMIAVDCNSGEVLWEPPNPDGWVMTHSSIVPMEFAGQRFYVYAGGSTASGGVVGVSAQDGSILWQCDDWRMRTNVPLPVVVGEGQLFLSAGYGQTHYGCALLRLSDNDGQIEAHLEQIHGTDVFGTMQQTPVFYHDHLYGVGMDNQLACLTPSGEVLWRSGSSETFGYGPYMIAGDHLLLLDDDGLLTLATLGTTGYHRVTQTEVFTDGVECWAPMALTAGRLIVRDLTRMKCLDLRN